MNQLPCVYVRVPCTYVFPSSSLPPYMSYILTRQPASQPTNQVRKPQVCRQALASSSTCTLNHHKHGTHMHLTKLTQAINPHHTRKALFQYIHTFLPKRHLRINHRGCTLKSEAKGPRRKAPTMTLTLTLAADTTLSTYRTYRSYHM